MKKQDDAELLNDSKCRDSSGAVIIMLANKKIKKYH
jgi:hypothetical protein